MSFPLKSILLGIVFIGLTACGGSDDSTTPTTQSEPTLTMTHWGVDFSAGYSPRDINDPPLDMADQDGYIVTWSDTGYITGESYGTGLWFSNTWDVIDPAGLVVYIEDLGDVTLASVTTVPENWHDITAPMPALQLGHVYVVKTKDGYAKFKVQSLSDPAGIDWYATVTYQYSATTTF